MCLRLASTQQTLAHALARTGKDRQWWLALAAGPMFWLALVFAGHAVATPPWPLAQPLAYLHLAVLMPMVEELLFRGLLQSWMLERSWGARRRGGISHANLLTSALFSALHLLHHPPLWALGVWFPSLLFGYFRERHASVLPGMLLHIVYNAGYFWWFFRPPA